MVESPGGRRNDTPGKPQHTSVDFFGLPDLIIAFSFLFSFRRAQGNHAQRRRSRNLTDQIPQNKKEMAFTRYLSGSHFFFCLDRRRGRDKLQPRKEKGEQYGKYESCHAYKGFAGDIEATLGSRLVSLQTIRVCL